MRHFRSVESYKHKCAKEVLCHWITEVPQLIGLNFKIPKILIEHKFGRFIPDLTVYIDQNRMIFLEIVNKSDLSGEKIKRIQSYCYHHDIAYSILQINAEWILSQIEIPYKMKYIEFK